MESIKRHTFRICKKISTFLSITDPLLHKPTWSLYSKQIGLPGIDIQKGSGLIEQIIPNLKWQKVYFAGFNALTPFWAKKIITALVESKKAEILWDADDYYVSNSMQEAGYFLRKEIEKKRT